MPTERESLSKNLEERYASQRAGGAYDAKQAGSTTVDDFNNEFSDGFTKGGKNTGLPKKESSFVKGLDTRKYAPGGGPRV
jgi:hypothetical protein